MRFTSPVRNALPALLTWSAVSSTVNAIPFHENELVARQGQTCYRGVYVIYARGSFEPQDVSLLSPVANAIVNQIPNSAAMQVVYPANADPTSEQQGYRAMKQLVENYNAACPQSKTVLMGYSQGALVVGDVVANSFASSSINAAAAKNVVTLAMFGDPGRNKDQGNISFEDSPCTASSIYPRNLDSYRQMAAYTDRLLDICSSGDPVCCAGGSNFIDHITYFTPERTQAIARYVAGKI